MQKKISDLQFIPELISVQIDKVKDYEKLFEDGFSVNGIKYFRLLCSAGMARRAVVMFCAETIRPQVLKTLDCERDLTEAIAPSKFNAYFSLSSSTTKLVTEPRFIVVPDYENEVEFMANYVTETDYDSDDELTLKLIKQGNNRTDGMGLICPQLAQTWAFDLGLDYTPSQYIIRQAFLKGLVTVFDFRAFCEEKNNGNYMVKTIYKDNNGNHIYKDLRETDIILSESQFKLWNSYKNEEDYIEKYRKNKLYWAISQYSPEEYEPVSNLNYQFLQILDLTDKQIEDICSLFVDWVRGVSSENIDYSLLYLVGRNTTEHRVQEYLESSEMYWVKCLIANRNVIADKYIKDKIRDYLKTSIENACLGTIPVHGNFQYLVSDPYAYAEHVCGLPVKGLLQDGEYYSNYWNNRSVDKVVGMRSPLTHFSEANVMGLISNDEVNKWYKWCKNGIILNWYSYDCVKFAGADKLLSRKLSLLVA